MPIRPLFPGSTLFRQRLPTPGEACAWCSGLFTAEYPIVETGQPAADRTYHDRCAVSAFPTHLVYAAAGGAVPTTDGPDPWRRLRALVRALRRRVPFPGQRLVRR